jgi:hypothetical protein
MACENEATLIRYAVRMTIECGDPVPPLPNLGIEMEFNAITKVSGISLGEEGTINVPYWGRQAQMSDGVRVFKPLAMEMRIPRDPFAPGSEFGRLAAMFNQRASLLFTIDVWITDRAFRKLMLVQFLNAEIRKFDFEDQEMGQAKVGITPVEFLPRDVKMYGCDGTTEIIGSTFDANSLVDC